MTRKREFELVPGDVIDYGSDVTLRFMLIKRCRPKTAWTVRWRVQLLGIVTPHTPAHRAHLERELGHAIGSVIVTNMLRKHMFLVVSADPS